MKYQITWNQLPMSLEELKALPQADLKAPEGTAALTVAALAVFPTNREECYRMLNFLRGPRPLSLHEQQFIRDRFMDGKDYLVKSYFKGATPANNYTPDVPYVLAFSDAFCRRGLQTSGHQKRRCRLAPSDHTAPKTLHRRMVPMGTVHPGRHQGAGQPRPLGII